MPRHICKDTTGTVFANTGATLETVARGRAALVSGTLCEHVRASIVASNLDDRDFWTQTPAKEQLFKAVSKAEEELTRALPSLEDFSMVSRQIAHCTLYDALLQAQIQMVDTRRGSTSLLSAQKAEMNELMSRFDAARDRYSIAIHQRFDAYEEGAASDLDSRLDALEELLELISDLLPALPDGPEPAAVTTRDTTVEWEKLEARHKRSLNLIVNDEVSQRFEDELAASIRLTHATVACLRVLPYTLPGRDSSKDKWAEAAQERAHQAAQYDPLDPWEELVMVPRDRSGKDGPCTSDVGPDVGAEATG